MFLFILKFGSMSASGEPSTNGRQTKPKAWCAPGGRKIKSTGGGYPFGGRMQGQPRPVRPD
jgi:hypothetical protein